MRIVVVGAGLGGLSAACHLTGAGHEVVVVERDTIPGGRAGRFESDGYQFDTGPTVLTMLGLLRSTFAAAGADMDDFVQVAPVDPMYRMCFDDGTTLRVRHGREAMQTEIREFAGAAEADAFGRFCDWLRKLYELEQPRFIDRNFNGPLSIANPPWPLVQLLRLGGLRKLHSVVEDYFADERLRKVFSFQAMYAGLSPFEALAIYCVITYMDSVEGVYFPTGGMHAIATGLEAAATKAGAEFRYGAEVGRILRSPSGAACGIELADGERLRADAVVANPDLPLVYRTLLDGIDAPRVARRGHYSPSCVVWHAGVRGDLPEGAAHHNVHFGGEWAGAFDALLGKGTLMPDPSILVTVPSHGDASMAPAGGHVLYVLEPVPNLDGRVDWLEAREPARARLIEHVRRLGYPVDDLVVDRFVDPLDWERDGMARGTPFALSHRFFQTGPFRPNNVDKRVPGLVLVGSGTLPGVGVPMVLSSGRLAAERIAEWDRSRNRTRGVAGGRR